MRDGYWPNSGSLPVGAATETGPSSKRRHSDLRLIVGASVAAFESANARLVPAPSAVAIDPPNTATLHWSLPSATSQERPVSVMHGHVVSGAVGSHVSLRVHCVGIVAFWKPTDIVPEPRAQKESV